jgi:FkbH-like protein
MEINRLKSLLLNGNPEFWDLLRRQTEESHAFEELFLLTSFRKKALARDLPPSVPLSSTIRLALLGGYSLHPFQDLLVHLLAMEGIDCELWQGSYDNYVSEIMDESSGLYTFAPQIVLLMPSESRCRYPGLLTDSREAQQAEAERVVQSLLELAGRVHDKTHAEVIMTNFMLPARYDLGAYRSRTLGSDWSFRKAVNFELGLSAPSHLHLCDMEFLAYRQGGLWSRDDRAWFESKQPCSAGFLVAFAREVIHLIGSFRRAPKKVVVLDLDNTLWGGVVADDGLEGIELGDTSPRGEAFKAFQKAILSLKQRGILLAVCSKNDRATAMEVFEKHPEMVLRMEDLVAFKANWEPKSDNIRLIAQDLNLGLDSFVFIDDTPAEIEIVRQFAPEVTTLLLGPDPSEYVAQLQDCRLFELQKITAEDAERTSQYRSEIERKGLQSASADMGAYLASLEMQATITEFTPVDIPRLAQLINKSNQFNLTTRRRTEAELIALMHDSAYVTFSVRLKDRFGDHGLISIVIARQADTTLEIDTWLMSCRVLKRQVEDEVLNELARLGRKRNCLRLEGLYLPTAKNEMVKDFYPSMGFGLIAESKESRAFALILSSFQPKPTSIKVTRHAYESN